MRGGSGKKWRGGGSKKLAGQMLAEVEDMEKNMRYAGLARDETE